jgi:hypothetical protein
MSFRAPLLAGIFGGVIALVAVTGLTSSTAQAEELHEVIAPPAQGRVGAKGRTTLTLTGKNGWHLNEQAPVTLKLTPSPGITVEKQKMVRKDLVEDTKDRARFDIPFVAKLEGAQSIEAEASFVVCQEAACKPIKQKVALSVAVAPAGKK